MSYPDDHSDVWVRRSTGDVELCHFYWLNDGPRWLQIYGVGSHTGLLNEYFDDVVEWAYADPPETGWVKISDGRH